MRAAKRNIEISRNLAADSHLGGPGYIQELDDSWRHATRSDSNRNVQKLQRTASPTSAWQELDRPKSHGWSKLQDGPHTLRPRHPTAPHHQLWSLDSQVGSSELRQPCVSFRPLPPRPETVRRPAGGTASIPSPCQAKPPHPAPPQSWIRNSSQSSSTVTDGQSPSTLPQRLSMAF